MNKKKRLEIYKKYGGHCAYCGIEIDLCNMQIDHIKSKASGFLGIDEPENFNPACSICNNWKHSDNVESFRSSIQQQVRKCRDYSRNFKMAERYGLVKEIIKPIVFFLKLNRRSDFMKIELDVSEKHEGTASPWWLIIDPKQMMKPDVYEVAIGMITGPFFSREEGQKHLNNHRRNFSKRALVYCHSGYNSGQYDTAYRKAEKKQEIDNAKD